MKIPVSDEQLESLINIAEQKYQYYWQNKVLPFLVSLRGKYTITRKEYNFLSKVLSDLEEGATR
jgi:hypothetical protein